MTRGVAAIRRVIHHGRMVQDDPKARTPIRSVRISDEVWHAAQARVAQTGGSMSDLIRVALINHLGLKNARGVLGRADRESRENDQ